MEQMRLPEAGLPPDEQGVVGVGGLLRDGAAGGVGELVGRAGDEGVEGVLRVETVLRVLALVLLRLGGGLVPGRRRRTVLVGGAGEIFPVLTLTVRSRSRRTGSGCTAGGVSTSGADSSTLSDNATEYPSSSSRTSQIRPDMLFSVSVLAHLEGAFRTAMRSTTITGVSCRRRLLERELRRGNSAESSSALIHLSRSEAQTSLKSTASGIAGTFRRVGQGQQDA
jgi:hypothetical protein